MLTVLWDLSVDRFGVDFQLCEQFLGVAQFDGGSRKNVDPGLIIPCL